MTHRNNRNKRNRKGSSLEENLLYKMSESSLTALLNCEVFIEKQMFDSYTANQAMLLASEFENYVWKVLAH